MKGGGPPLLGIKSKPPFKGKKRKNDKEDENYVMASLNQGSKERK